MERILRIRHGLFALCSSVCWVLIAAGAAAESVPWLYDGKPEAGPLGPTRVDLQTLVSTRARQENLVENIEYEFFSETRWTKDSSVMSRTSGRWLYDPQDYRERVTLRRNIDDNGKPSWVNEFGFDGVESRSWTSENNSGHFEPGRHDGNIVTFPYDPSVLSSPLFQEAPTLTFSEIMSGGKGKLWSGASPTEAAVIGRQSLRVLGGTFPAIVVDIKLPASFRARLWLSETEEYVPRRILHYGTEGLTKDKPLWDVVVDEMRKMDTPLGAVYVPVSGRIGGIGNSATGQYVQTTQCVATAIRLNEPRKQEDYRFEWPEQALVVDDGSGDWGYMVGGKMIPGREWDNMKSKAGSVADLEASPKENLAAASSDGSAAPAVTAEEPVQLPSSPRQQALGFGLALLLLLLVVVVAGIWRSSEKKSP